MTFKKLLAVILIVSVVGISGMAQILTGISPAPPRGAGGLGGALGGGIIVHDPANGIILSEHTVHMLTEIAKAIAILEMVTNQYQHMRYMAQFIQNQVKYSS